MKAALLLLATGIFFNCQGSTVIDVSQLLVPTKNDYGNGSGQIFTPGIDGYLEGISVYLIKSGKGADVVLTVYTLNDTVTAFKSAVGSATIKANLISGTGGWVYFDLPVAFLQTANVALAFTASQPLSGASGFVNFGDNLSNPYRGGSFIHSSGLAFTRTAGTDLGFQTTVTPIPEVGGMLVIFTAGAGMAVRRRR